MKEPWDREWKTNFRTRIRSCKGVIGIITKNTPNADGQIWELKCAVGEKKPLLLSHGHPWQIDRLTVLPTSIERRKVYSWSQSTIIKFLNGL